MAVCKRTLSRLSHGPFLAWGEGGENHMCASTPDMVSLQAVRGRIPTLLHRSILPSSSHPLATTQSEQHPDYQTKSPPRSSASLCWPGARETTQRAPSSLLCATLHRSPPQRRGLRCLGQREKRSIMRYARPHTTRVLRPTRISRVRSGTGQRSGCFVLVMRRNTL